MTTEEKEFRFYNLHPGRKWKKTDLSTIHAILTSHQLSPEKQVTTVTSYPFVDSNPKSRSRNAVTLRHIRNDSTGFVRWETKTLLRRENRPRVFAQHVTSLEEGYYPKNVPTGDPTSVRKRERYTYQGQGFRFDVTIVEDDLEIELEYTTANGDDIAKEFIDLLYPNSSMVVRCNELLTNGFASFTTTEARAFSVRDFTATTFLDRITYYVAPKADGERHFLYLSRTGCCLVSMTSYHNLTSNPSDSVKVSDDLTWDGGEVLVEGELLGTTFYAYDLPYLNTDVRSENYTERRRRLAELRISPFIVPSLGEIQYVLKAAYRINCTSEFFRYTAACFDVDFSIDGVIYTPDVGYYPRNGDGKLVQMKPVRERVGSGLPDIMKWKNSVSVDLLYKNKMLYVKGISDNKAFTPREPYTLAPYPYEDGKVYEFEYRDQVLRHLRRRDDKSHGNKEDVAYDNWNSMVSPFTKDMLLGRDIYLIRKHHNYLKGEIFRRLLPGDILDIGSGRGGDILKYPVSAKVYAVEPNPENYTEALKRHASFLEKRKVGVDIANITYYQKGGEDYEFLSHLGRVKNVTMMLSASFFWKSEEMLQQLAMTIDKSLLPGGRFVMFTINGDSLHLVQHYDALGVKLDIQSTRKGISQQVLASFPGDTIVGEKQVEYCVYPSILLRTLGSRYRMLPNPSLEQHEPFLSPEQRRLNYLYSVHIFEKISDEREISVSLAVPGEIKDIRYNLYHYFPGNTWYRAVKHFAGAPGKGKMYRIPFVEKGLTSSEGFSMEDLFYFPHEGDTLTVAVLGAMEKKFHTFNEKNQLIRVMALRRYFQDQFHTEFRHELMNDDSTLPLWCFLSRGFFAEEAAMRLNNKENPYLCVNLMEYMLNKNLPLTETHIELLAEEFNINIFVFEARNGVMSLRCVTFGNRGRSLLLLKSMQDGKEVYATLRTMKDVLFPDTDTHIEALRRFYVPVSGNLSSLDIANNFVTLYRTQYVHFNPSHLNNVDSTMRRYLETCAPVIG